MPQVATTIWKPSNGQGEFHNIDPVYIVDPVDSSIFLVDPVDSNVFIVSTDLDFTPVASTVWVENPAS